MKEKKSVSRREFLRLSGLATVGATLAACAPEVKPVKETVEVTKEVVKEVTKVPSEYVEAPSLKEKVEAGELPPIDDRLPVEPSVVGGREEIGEYGGTVRMMHMHPQTFISQYGWFSERMLTYSDLDFATLQPSIIESWETPDEGKSWVLRLRKGMKWSDGELLTTEDVAFWWEDIMTNDELTTVVPWQFRHGGERMKVEIIDDYTFKFTFAEKFGNFPAYCTRWHQGWIVRPKHYLKQFHADYADKEDLEALIEEEGFDTWVQLFNAKYGGNYVWGAQENSAEYPFIGAWIVTQAPEKGTVILERNPYYWKVDQAGNQLPYTDKIRISLAARHEIVQEKIIEGELDYVGPHDVSIARYPLYKENEDKAAYVVGDNVSCMTDRYTLYPNHTLPDDPVLQKIVRNPDFVKALSLAIDREEVNQSLYYGLAQMGQMGPMPQSDYYEPEFGRAYAEFDPERANKLLDEMGLDERNEAGWRLRPDGKRLDFNIQHAGPRVGVATQEYCEMVVTYWRDIGIHATVKEIEISLYDERWRTGKIHCGVWHNDRCTNMLLPLEMRWYLPTHSTQGGSAPLWGRWFETDGEEGEEPPGWMLELYDKWAEMNATTDRDHRIELGKEILRAVLVDRLMAIGSILESPLPIVFNEDMGNLPRPDTPIGWDTYGISTFHPEAFFYHNPEKHQA